MGINIFQLSMNIIGLMIFSFGC